MFPPKCKDGSPWKKIQPRLAFECDDRRRSWYQLNVKLERIQPMSTLEGSEKLSVFNKHLKPKTIANFLKITDDF